MRTMMRVVLSLGLGASVGPVIAGPVTFGVERDYMSSGFFQGNTIRGDEAPSTRRVNRATSPGIFGVTGETSYFGFGFDPSLFAGPVALAVFRVEVVANGFFADPSSGNPAGVSLHSLTADPLSSIDEDLPSGPGSFVDFRDAQITTGSVVSTATVDGLGVFEWDITGLVNEWIANGNGNFAYTIGTSVLLDPDPDTAVGFINSSFSGLSGEELTARIVVVPGAGAGVLVLAGLGAGCVRRRR